MSRTPDAVDRIIEQWRRERPDLPLQAMALLGRLQRASHLLGPMLGREFERFGLSAGEFDVLATLRRSGAPFVLSPTALYATLMISSGTMTHRLKLLEQRGLVERLPNPEDSRSLLVRLSDSGHALIDEAVGAHTANEEQLLAGMDATDRAALEQGLRALLAQWEPE
ncbi:DNA-binding MarR family transcriptional regulator [Neisseria sp. HSC-16F19]|nr:MarR family transcriptional regulator [Neisseria sp. HSC-16F19]MCP2041567.1 DNA-binding MarR family transcriptional regulator [Neisseria sp. HSC-16F19]